MWRWIKRVSATLLVAILALVGVLTFNTLRYTPPEIAQASPYVLDIDMQDVTRQLSRAVQYRTISTDRSHPDFAAFLDFLEAEFPTVHATAPRQVLKRNTPLFRWEGKDPARAPILLAAHYDVVPVAEGSEDRWEHPPFGGAVADGFVWGRGTLDNKGALIAILATAETLMKQGFQPQRTIYFSFGGDEEVGGIGAFSVASALNEQGIELDWALDEGSFVLDRMIPGLEQPVASINVAEKGYLTVKLVARGTGGHSSMPPGDTAVGRLARAVDRIQNAPVPGGLTGISAEFFDNLGRYFTRDRRLVFANRWLFGPILEGILAGAPSTNAMLRTTTAPTMLSGSQKENVLATEATATINFRLHPRDTIESVLAHVKAVIDDPEVEIIHNPDSAKLASPVADSEAQGYRDIANAITRSFGPTATVPGLTIAATDARHYARAARGAYRINPFKITSDDLTRFHGTNERLSLENLERGVNFYGALITAQ